MSGKKASPLIEVTAAVAASRRAACLACEHRRETGSCGLLGCSCLIGIYLLRPWSTCPMGRWPTDHGDAQPDSTRSSPRGQSRTAPT
jgi:hypothetical protein